MNEPEKRVEPPQSGNRLPLLLLLFLGLALWAAALPWARLRPGQPPGFSLTASGYTTLDPGLPTDSPSPPHLAIFTFDPISLNRADQQTLAFLPGIGPTLARRIIEHRQAHGPFQSTDQLLQVPGIGPKTLARIRPLVSP